MEAQVERRPYAEGAEQKAVLTGLLVGVLVVGIDSTIVATILPRMLSEFGDLPLAPWVFASYMLMQIASAPILGKLSDRFGRKRVLLFGLFTFLLGSELIAFSRSFGELILFRGLQGIGAGAILPAALATLFLDFPPEMRPRLQGNFSAVYGVSNILGPLLGAVLAEHVGWRYAFHINIVFVSVSVYCISRSLRDTRGSQRKGELDWAGALTLIASIVLISIAAMQVGGAEAVSALSVGPSYLAALGLLAVGLFAWVEHRASDPIIPGYFIREKTLAVLGNLVTGAVMYSFIFFLPLFLRAVLRASPGTGLIPLTFSLVAGSVLGGRLITRYGTRTTSMLAAGVLVLGALAATQLKASTPLFALAIIGPCIGIGVGGLLVSMVITMQAGTPAVYMGVSSSLSQFMRNLGGLLSVNLLSAMQAAVFRAGLPVELRSTLTQAGGAKELAESLFSGAAEGGAQVIAAYTRASTTVFWACALLGGVALLISFRLPRVRLEAEAHQEAEAH